MKTKIIAKIEEALFALHPEVKPFYTVINLVKELSLGEEIPETIPSPSHSIAPVVIDKPNSVVSTVSKMQNNYSPDYNLQTRVLYIIKELGQFVKMSDIITKIKEYEPDFGATISPVLTHLKLTGVLKNYMPTGNRKLTYWGLTEWNWEGIN